MHQWYAFICQHLEQTFFIYKSFNYIVRLKYILASQDESEYDPEAEILGTS